MTRLHWLIVIQNGTIFFKPFFFFFLLEEIVSSSSFCWVEEDDAESPGFAPAGASAGRVSPPGSNSFSRSGGGKGCPPFSDTLGVTSFQSAGVLGFRSFESVVTSR